MNGQMNAAAAPVPTADNVTAATGPDVNHADAVRVEKLRILHDYVVVRPLAVPSKKHGGMIHLAETSQERERSHRGIVLQLGPGDWNEPGTARVPMSVQVGDLVFFGKFAGTEEEIGGRGVLVMRESECRMSVPAGAFQVVEHNNPKLDHLVEDWCEVCHGIPLEQAAKEALALEREALLVGKRPGVDGAEALELDKDIRTGSAPSVFREPTVADVNVEIAQLGLVLPVVTGVTEQKRPCGGDDGIDCRFMQRKYQTADGPIWLGLRCGHWHKALFVE